MSPGAEWTDAVPPNPSMTALTIASPRPVEWAALLCLVFTLAIFKSSRKPVEE